MVTPSLIYIGVFILSTLTLTAVYSAFKPEIKGAIGEHKVNKQLKKLEKHGKGKFIKNLMLLTKDGISSQLDQVFINRSGIFVIETKNFSGKLEGRETDSEWLQYKGNYYNSVHNFARQNYGHMKALQPIVDKYPNLPVYSILSFNPSCILNLKLQKTIATNYNTLNNAIKIRSRTPHISEEQVELIYKELKFLKRQNISVGKTHIARLSLQKDYDNRAKSRGMSRKEMDEILIEKYENHSAFSIDLTTDRKTDLDDTINKASVRSQAQGKCSNFKDFNDKSFFNKQR